MSTVTKQERVSVEKYLEGELTSEIKHELIDCHVYAMAGASKNHERIVQNISRKFGNHLENSPCEPFGSDTKVRVRDNFYYPDVLVDCRVDETRPYYTETPVILIEVISKSTRKMDEKIKLIQYINIPSLQEYVLVEQDIVDVTVYRKSDDWRSTHYFLGETIHFESIDLRLSVEEIYHRVKNDDMVAFMQNKQEEAGQ
jgi:Uma2 family endonuclease